MLPLSLLKTSQGHPMLVELKNGETYNGHLVSCDTWMNVHLREVICTSKDGDRFWRMANCYVRGNTIKYICVPDEVIGLVDCDVYTYRAVAEGDPFTDEANLWSFNYFFYSKKLKRILYFSCRAVSKTAEEDSDDGYDDPYNGMEDSFVDGMDMDEEMY